MQEFAEYLGSLEPLYHFSIMAAFLACVWAALRLAPKLRPYTGQILTLAAILWVGAMFSFISVSFPKPKGMMASATNASTIPRVWAAALVPFALLALYPMAKGYEKPDKPWKNLKLVALMLVIIVSSLLLFDIIGYYLSSALFIFAVMLALGSRSKVQLIAVPAGWVIFTYLVFAELLSVPLPLGKLFSFL